MHRLRLVLTLLGLVLTGLLASSLPARADLRVCNNSSDQVSIALGYRAQQGWQSEGWWVAAPEKCAVVYQGDLHSRFFYLYVADDIGGGTWDGSVFMCTRDESFTIFGVEDCLARGYERTGFFEVDTQNRTDWTLQLTDAPNSGPGQDTNGAPLGDETAGPANSSDQPPADASDDGGGGDDQGTDDPGGGSDDGGTDAD